MDSPSVAEHVLVLLSESGERVVVQTSPFRVGRNQDNDLTLLLSDVSGLHAEFTFQGSLWSVFDHGSTNGTFVNAVRVTDHTVLNEGDLLHLGNNGFRVAGGSGAGNKGPTKLLPSTHAAVRAALDVVRVVSKGLVYSHFQPVVDLKTQATLGWEALGRAQTDSGAGPAPLLAVADEQQQAVALSNAFAGASVQCAECRHCWPTSNSEYLFLNAHPRQLEEGGFPDLIAKLGSADLQKWYRMVVEIPESLVCNTDQMAGWVREIRKGGMYVAYDDFGRGQSRITDLIAVPPDFLKLDRVLISNIGQAPAKQTLVKAVVEACKTLGTAPIAEGVETEAERQGCLEMGVEIGQGYLFCRPNPAYNLFDSAEGTLPPTCPFVRLELLSPDQ